MSVTSGTEGLETRARINDRSNKIKSVQMDQPFATNGDPRYAIAQLIKDAMGRDGFTSIRRFALSAGIAPATVYNIISSTTQPRIRLGTLFKLETALDTPVAQLIELFRPAGHPPLERERVKALGALRGKYAGASSLSTELHDERRAERA